MNLDDIFSLLENIASSNYIAKPLLVGGIPRDIYLGVSKDDYRDIDITTNTPDVTRLGITFAENTKSNFLMFEDGHLTVHHQDYSYDFSSNFISDKVVDYLNNNLNIYDQKFYEIYSRDFTINTLHKEFFSDKILDPTRVGIDDCNNKIIKTICPPEITLVDDARRAFRAIEFATRFGFQIDTNIINFIKENLELFSIEKNPIIKESYVSGIIFKSLENNSEKTLSYLIESNLFYNIPLVGKFKEELIKKRLILKYLDNNKKY